MHGRLRAPTHADASAVLEVVLARDIPGDTRVAEDGGESVGMWPTWEARRWEKELAGA